MCGRNSSALPVKLIDNKKDISMIKTCTRFQPCLFENISYRVCHFDNKLFIFDKRTAFSDNKSFNIDNKISARSKINKNSRPKEIGQAIRGSTSQEIGPFPKIIRISLLFCTFSPKIILSIKKGPDTHPILFLQSRSLHVPDLNRNNVRSSCSRWAALIFLLDLLLISTLHCLK